MEKANVRRNQAMTKQSRSAKRMRMALSWLAVVALGAVLQAQAPASQKPPAGGNANPFPEDTGSVPVMPNTAAGLNAATSSGDVPPMAADLPTSDMDPVRSPDDVPPAVDDAAPASGFSSSRSGLDSVLPDPNAPDPKGKGRKLGKHDEPPPHVETAAEDIKVGKYYLDNKNWRAALSRFQSAMVLAPEEPDVYWGMAESQRHLGDFAGAKGNYQKVLDYDPDSHHAKEAAKLLKTPEMAK
jgi:tetratricopeptide (TPR) repeat protein